MNSQPKYLPAEERRAVTVEAVVQLAARHMGVTQGALFKHFPNKDAILEAVMAWVAEHLLARVDRAAQAAASPGAAIEAMFLAHVGFVCDHPGVPRMLLGELQRAQPTAPRRMAQTLLRHYRERLQRLFEAAIANGELPATLDVDAAAILLVGTVQGLVVQSLLAGDVDHIPEQYFLLQGTLDDVIAAYEASRK